MPVSTSISTREVSKRQVAFNTNKKKSTNFFESIDFLEDLEFEAGENITLNNLVYLSSDGLIYNSSYQNNPAIGIATKTVAVGERTNLLFSGDVIIDGLSHLPGTELFLTDGVLNFSDTLPTLATNNIIQKIGTVLNSSKILLRIENPFYLE
jgi:hypothetical protein